AVSHLSHQESDRRADATATDHDRCGQPDQLAALHVPLLRAELAQQARHDVMEMSDVLEKFDFRERPEVIKVRPDIKKASAGLSFSVIDGPHSASVSGFGRKSGDRSHKNQ